MTKTKKMPKLKSKPTNNFGAILKLRENMIKKEQVKGDVLKKLGARFHMEMQASQKAKEYQKNGIEYKD